jgi:uncharacterized protein YqeY
MSIVDHVSSELKAAMKARDKLRTTALRGIRAALIEELKSGRGDEVGDDRALELIRRLAKQRKESIDAYEAGGREDLAEAERAELAVLEEFLPKLADEAQTRAWVQEAIEAAGATGLGDIGKVMGRLMGAHKGELDGGLANRLVRELLG